MPDAASSEAETADTSALEHAGQVQIRSAAHMSSRSFPAANVAVSTPAVEPGVIISHPPEQKPGGSNAGCAKGGHSCRCSGHNAGASGSCSCVTTSDGVAEAKSDSVPNDYASGEDERDDWTQNGDDTLLE